MNGRMKQFGQSINSLLAGKDLTREETRDLFSEILLGEQSEIHQGAFLSAITAKGPSPKEIAGAWQAIFELDTTKVVPEVQGPKVDNCGTGIRQAEAMGENPEPKSAERRGEIHFTAAYGLGGEWIRRNGKEH
jgi:hypothetical protein